MWPIKSKLLVACVMWTHKNSSWVIRFKQIVLHPFEMKPNRRPISSTVAIAKKMRNESELRGWLFLISPGVKKNERPNMNFFKDHIYAILLLLYKHQYTYTHLQNKFGHKYHPHKLLFSITNNSFPNGYVHFIEEKASYFNHKTITFQPILLHSVLYAYGLPLGSVHKKVLFWREYIAPKMQNCIWGRERCLP